METGLRRHRGNGATRRQIGAPSPPGEGGWGGTSLHAALIELQSDMEQEAEMFVE